MNKILRGRKGFGLIELLVAMAISSVLLAAISTATVHLVTFTKDNANSMTAIEQVQNVGFWVKRDAVSAQRAYSRCFCFWRPQRLAAARWKSALRGN